MNGRYLIMDNWKSEVFYVIAFELLLFKLIGMKWCGVEWEEVW